MSPLAMSTSERRALSPGAAWLVVSADEVPVGWRDRVLTVALLPLPAGGMSDEPERRRPTADGVSGRLQETARLLLSGHTRQSIARHTGVSMRTVERDVARLRESSGASSLTELAATLALRSFDGTDPPAW
jgi:hypothetical protein